MKTIVERMDMTKIRHDEHRRKYQLIQTTKEHLDHIGCKTQSVETSTSQPTPMSVDEENADLLRVAAAKMVAQNIYNDGSEGLTVEVTHTNDTSDISVYLTINHRKKLVQEITFKMEAIQ
jgi:hypothetical protein